MRIPSHVGVIPDGNRRWATNQGFTMENTKRTSIQTRAFQKACVQAAEMLLEQNANLLVLGNSKSNMFPKELLEYTKRRTINEDDIKVNLLVNYGWQWDLKENDIKSKDISRMDLIIRWGGRRRLSGFLPKVDKKCLKIIF